MTEKYIMVDEKQLAKFPYLLNAYLDSEEVEEKKAAAIIVEENEIEMVMVLNYSSHSKSI